jgi:hypothetical protein
MSNDSNPPSSLAKAGCGMLFALPFVAAGMYMMAISLGYLPSNPESFKAPPMILTAAGAVFVLGGLFVLLQISFGQGGQQTAIYKWLELFILGGFLLVFATIFLWVGFGPGERTFSSSTGAGPVTVSGKGDPLTGRLIFGTFGLGTLLAAIVYIYKKIMTLPFGGDEPLE